MNKDTVLLAEAYDQVVAHYIISNLINEFTMPMMSQQVPMASVKDPKSLDYSSIDKYLDYVKNFSEFLPSFLKYLKNISVIGLSVGVAAHVIGWGFIAISKLLDKNVKLKQQVKQQFMQQGITRELGKLDSDEIDEDTLKQLNDKLSEQMAKKFPNKGKSYWAEVMNKVGEFLKGKIGTLGFALAGVTVFSALSDVPIAPELKLPKPAMDKSIT